MLSKANKNIIDVYNKGFRVIRGEVISPYTHKPRALNINKSGYKRFTVKINKKCCSIMVHKLLAYQKYGTYLFKNDIVVRHLDGDSLNNSYKNVVIGDSSENMLDIPEDNRLFSSITAATNRRKFTDTELVEIRKFHKGSYKETMEVFNISSKGSLHYILNNDYKTKV